MMQKLIWILIISLLIIMRIYFGIFFLEKYQSRPINHSSKIVINSVMKSGSTFVTKTLLEGLDYSLFTINTDQDSKNIKLGQFFNSKQKILKLHVTPRSIDWGEYLKYSDRMIVQIRDPRQAALSWVHHILVFAKQDNNIDIEKFKNLGLEKQIDWVIDNKLPNMISFITKWDKFKGQQDKLAHGVKILITSYDELVENEEKFIYKILKFYQIPPQQFSYKKLARDHNVLYRKADPNEWKIVLNKQQKDKINSMIPDEMFAKFGWSK